MHVHALAILAYEEAKALFSVKEFDLAVRHSDSCLYSRALTRMKQAPFYRAPFAGRKIRGLGHPPRSAHAGTRGAVSDVGFTPPSLGFLLLLPASPERRSGTEPRGPRVGTRHTRVFVPYIDSARERSAGATAS